MNPIEYFGGGKLVLVVDDQPDFCLAMQHLLSVLGFRTVIASNGRQALTILDREKIDVVLTDLFMPHMDGLELLRKMREGEKPMLPVIAVTGEARTASHSVGGAAAALGAR